MEDIVLVPAGEFLMGSAESDRDAGADEKPQRRVYLDAYWIDRHEVTVGQFRTFCQATGREMPPVPPWGWQDDHPVLNARWEEAAAYARWAGKRLPTEAEWEKAARGTDGRRYPWGNDWDTSKCASGHNSTGSTQPVGSYPSGASPYGVLDMAGNVYEWCADWYDKDYYAYGPERNPPGPSAGEYHVLRGGSWADLFPRLFRCAYRDYFYLPDYRHISYGFRCVRSAEA